MLCSNSGSSYVFCSRLFGYVERANRPNLLRENGMHEVASLLQ
jgi:hypothetical protein